MSIAQPTPHASAADPAQIGRATDDPLFGATAGPTHAGRDPFQVIGRAGVPCAAAGAAIALAAGAIHGFGPDDESMVGRVHIALGHALPILTFTLMMGLIAALIARAGTRCSRVQLAGSAVAMVGLVVWSAVTAIHSLGFYAVARIDPQVAAKLAKASPPVLVGAVFAASVLLVVTGLVAALASAAKQKLVPGVAAVLIVLGTPGSFFAGPVGDGLLAIGLGWAAMRLVRRARA